MLEYSQATPIVQLMNGNFDLDIWNSKYANIRYAVAVDQVITIDAKYEANLPGLAYDYYGDQSYWRAILAFNGLADPINDVAIGATLSMPSKTSIDAFMASKQNVVTVTL